MHTPDEFDRIKFESIMGHEFPPKSSAEYTDPTPYGTPTQPHNPGLTKRGKAAIAIGATVIAGGSLIAYQNYSAQQTAQETKAQEIALQQQRLKLEELKVQNQLSESSKKAQNHAENTRQASIDSCVKSQKDQIGKMGVTYRSVVDDCQAQYAPTGDTSNIQTTASANETDTNTSGDGLNGGLVLGGLALGGFLVTVMKSKRNNPA